MRKKTWIRYGLASVIMLGGSFSALAVGCGGDDNGPITSTDSGADHTNPFPDSGGQEGGGHDTGTSDAPADVHDAGPPHAKIILVNASPNGDFRMCLGQGRMADGSDTMVAPLPAIPHDDSKEALGRNYPGFYSGVGGVFPDLADFQPIAATLFLIPANNPKIAGDVLSADAGVERSCDVLIGATGQGGPLVKNTDYIQAPTIPANTFQHGNTYLVAITGCLPGNTSPTATLQCGSSYSATTGNLGMKIVQLDKTVADTTKMGVQVLHLAQPLDGYMGAGAAQAGGSNYTNIVGLSNSEDGGPANAPAVVGINYGGFAPDAAAPQNYGQPTEYANFSVYTKGVATFPALDGGTQQLQVFPPPTTGLPAFPQPFFVTQALSYGTFDGGIGVGPAGQPLYMPGGNFTLILVGDPTAQGLYDGGSLNPNYDGHGFHMMMFPNDPAVSRGLP